jgi:microcystin-dependent protein
MGGFRHTGVQNAAARTDYAAAGQVQDGTLIWAGITGGSANAQTLASNPPIPALVDGQEFSFRAGFTNTGATTFSDSGLPTHPVTFQGNALIGGELAAGQNYSASWNATTSSYELDRSALLGTHPVPPGTMAPFGAAAPPAGWLLCNGSAISRTTYAALFAAIGTTWGAGDGSTTFNLPDTRGRVIAGYDAGNATGRLTGAETGGVSAAALANSGGEQGHALASAENATHNHGITDPGHVHPITDPEHAHGLSNAGGVWSSTVSGAEGIGSGPNVTTLASIANAATGISVDNAVTGISTTNQGLGSPHNNVQPTLIVPWIIRT